VRLEQRVRTAASWVRATLASTTGPAIPMLFAAQMLPVAEGGFTWRQSDYRKWLGEAGFASVDIVPTPSTLVFAT